MRNYIGNNIHQIRINYGLSQESLAEIADVSQTAISSWECGQSVPRISNAENIINHFPELEMDDIYSEELGYAKRVLRKNDPFQNEKVVYVSLYGSIAAGIPLAMVQYDEELPIPTVLHERYPDAFYLKVKGESMNRVLPNGCYALVDPSSDTVDGKVHAVRVGNTEATIKRVHKLNNGISLEPDSYDPTYKTRIFDYADDKEETLDPIGRVVWYFVPYNFEI